MTHPQNALEVEMLLHACVRAEYTIPRSGAHEEALDRLLRADMVTVENTTRFVVGTPRGKFWLRHICNVPYPVETYSIPGDSK